MKFKQITLYNFMRYKGTVVIPFSTDPEKNVTVITGDNTFGKTTICQAFRWGLFGDVISTNYTNKKDVIYLNHEVIAGMNINQNAEVRVEIVVQDESVEYTFVRKQYFRRKTTNPANFSIVPVADSSLSMQITENGVAGDIISNNGNGKKFGPGCVTDQINSMFPEKLSGYYFFDGERWNNDAGKNKTEEVKQSINTILGVSSLLKMMAHLKDGTLAYKTSAVSTLKRSIKGSSTESQDLKNKIAYQEELIAKQKDLIAQKTADREVSKANMDKYDQILRDGKKEEEDQRTLVQLEKEISRNERYRDESYADIVKAFSSKADMHLTSELLSKVNQLLEQVDLEGKDIPGVTSDTIDYLLKQGICICGQKLTEGDEHYKAMMRLREEVYPNKIGGPAKIYKTTLFNWNQASYTIVDDIHDKAETYESQQNDIDDASRKKAALEEKIDKKRNMAAVRQQYNINKANYEKEDGAIRSAEATIKAAESQIESLEAQLKSIEALDKANIPIYRAIDYAEALYKQAALFVDKYEKPIISELNDLIRENFEKMFDSKEKYAKLGPDYQVRMYYRSIGGVSDIEEDNLSNGERIAINFVYIVSILELARKRKEAENQSDTVLSLPLVLDAPFSNLSTENTGLVASKLPEFAEQVIIFTLDKDLEASGLAEHMDNNFYYEITREYTENSSTVSHKSTAEKEEI